MPTTVFVTEKIETKFDILREHIGYFKNVIFSLHICKIRTFYVQNGAAGKFSFLFWRLADSKIDSTIGKHIRALTVQVTGHNRVIQSFVRAYIILTIPPNLLSVAFRGTYMGK